MEKIFRFMIYRFPVLYFEPSSKSNVLLLCSCLMYHKLARSKTMQIWFKIHSQAKRYTDLLWQFLCLLLYGCLYLQSLLAHVGYSPQ